MSESILLQAKDVAKELGISKGHAYKLIRDMNEQLQSKGFLVIQGRISKEYFYERVYRKGVR